MAYDVETYRADHKLLGFRDPSTLPTIEGLIFRVESLNRKPGVDQDAIAAAAERLFAWCKSGDPVPGVEQLDRTGAGQGGRTAAATSKEATEKAAEEAKVKAKTEAMVAAAVQAYDLALAGQDKRHRDRRGKYPKAHPGVAG